MTITEMTAGDDERSPKAISISFPFGGVIAGDSKVSRGLAPVVELRENSRKTLIE
jgi:hypothetical protein